MYTLKYGVDLAAVAATMGQSRPEAPADRLQLKIVSSSILMRLRSPLCLPLPKEQNIFVFMVDTSPIGECI